MAEARPEPRPDTQPIYQRFWNLAPTRPNSPPILGGTFGHLAPTRPALYKRGGVGASWGSMPFPNPAAPPSAPQPASTTTAPVVAKRPGRPPATPTP